MESTMPLFVRDARVLIVVLLLASGLLSAPAHAGMVAFFDVPDARKQCPEGWTEFLPAKGRLILGTTDPAQVGRASGTGIEDLTPPKHRHAFTAGVKLNPRPVIALSGPNQTLAGSNVEHTVSATTELSDGNVPYMQLLACEQKNGFPAEQALPREMVAFFSTPSCPAEWAPYEKLNGRFAVPLPSDAQSADFNAAVGTAGTAFNHVHKLVVSAAAAAGKLYLPISGGSMALAESLWPFRQNTDYGHRTFADQESTTGAGGDDAVPRVSLMACIRTAGRPRTSELPDDILAFMTAEDCPKHWRQKPASMGRYLVGLPAGPYAQSGVPFGGTPLRSKEQRGHVHEVRASLVLPSRGIAGVSGCCLNDFAVATTYTLQGQSVAAANHLPYVQMRHCIATPEVRQAVSEDIAE
jgi:hypothetical protein